MKYNHSEINVWNFGDASGHLFVRSTKPIVIFYRFLCQQSHSCDFNLIFYLSSFYLASSLSLSLSTPISHFSHLINSLVRFSKNILFSTKSKCSVKRRNNVTISVAVTDDCIQCKMHQIYLSFCRFVLHTSRWPQLSALSLAAASALPLAPIFFLFSYLTFVCLDFVLQTFHLKLIKDSLFRLWLFFSSLVVLLLLFKNAF